MLVIDSKSGNVSEIKVKKQTIKEKKRMAMKIVQYQHSFIVSQIPTLVDILSEKQLDFLVETTNGLEKLHKSLSKDVNGNLDGYIDLSVGSVSNS